MLGDGVGVAKPSLDRAVLIEHGPAAHIVKHAANLGGGARHMGAG